MYVTQDEEASSRPPPSEVMCGGLGELSAQTSPHTEEKNRVAMLYVQVY